LKSNFYELKLFPSQNHPKSNLFNSKPSKIKPFSLKNHQNQTFFSQKPSKSNLFLSKTIKIKPFLGGGGYPPVTPPPHKKHNSPVSQNAEMSSSFSKIPKMSSSF